MAPPATLPKIANDTSVASGASSLRESVFFGDLYSHPAQPISGCKGLLLLNDDLYLSCL